MLKARTALCISTLHSANRPVAHPVVKPPFPPLSKLPLPPPPLNTVESTGLHRHLTRCVALGRHQEPTALHLLPAKDVIIDTGDSLPFAAPYGALLTVKWPTNLPFIDTLSFSQPYRVRR